MTRRTAASRTLLLGTLCAAGALISAGARPGPPAAVLSLGLPRSVETVFGNPSQQVLVNCTGIVRVSSLGTVRAEGLRLVRNTLDLDASRVKLFAQVAVFGPSLFGPSCDSFYAGITSQGFRWSLVSRPAGSTAAIGRPETLSANLRLDRPGQYVVRFVACENDSCSMTAT